MSKPAAVKAPPVPAPAAMPQDTGEAADSEAKKVRRSMGYMSNIVTGNLAPRSTGKKATLG
jgi:hypothetical protein